MKYIVRSIILLSVINYIKSCNVGDLHADTSDCTRYSVCESSVCNGSKNLTISCTAETYFDPIAKSCSLNYTCPPDKVVQVVECACPNAIIPDPNDPASYTICRARSATKLMYAKHILCAPGLVFDAKVQGCINNDDPDDVSNCPEPKTTIRETGQDCLDGETLKIKPLNLSQPCEEEGIFPSTYNSISYYICQRDECGNLIKTPRVCSGFLNFCPRKRYCTSCPFKQLCSAEVNDFVCPGEGNFPDPTCKFAYYTCFVTYKITYFPKRFTCPNGLVYDPFNKVCTFPNKVCTKCRNRINQCNLS